MNPSSDPFQDPHPSDRPFGWFFAIVAGVAMGVLIHTVAFSDASSETRTVVACLAVLAAAASVAAALVMFKRRLSVVLEHGVITHRRSSLGGTECTNAPVDEEGTVVIRKEVTTDSDGGQFEQFFVDYEHPRGTVELRRPYGPDASRVSAWRYATFLGVDLIDRTGFDEQVVTVEEQRTPFLDTVDLEALDWPRPGRGNSRLSWSEEDGRTRIDIAPTGFGPQALFCGLLAAGFGWLGHGVWASMREDGLNWWSVFPAGLLLIAATACALALLGVWDAFRGRETWWVDGTGFWSRNQQHLDVDEIRYESTAESSKGVQFITLRGPVTIGQDLPSREQQAIRALFLLTLAAR